MKYYNLDELGKYYAKWRKKARHKTKDKRMIPLILNTWKRQSHRERQQNSENGLTPLFTIFYQQDFITIIK